jgi:hypothetical protein
MLKGAQFWRRAVKWLKESVVCACLLLAARPVCQAQAPPPAVPANPPPFVPITQAERTREYLKSLVSPVDVVSAAAGAGLSQWRDSPREWKQGGAGYGRRFANDYAGHLARATMMFGASSLLHEDNRYFTSGRRGAGARLKYALESTFLARRNDGSRRFSYSRIGAGLGTAILSRTWVPPSWDHPRNVAINFGITLAVEAGFNVGREFLPFLRRR